MLKHACLLAFVACVSAQIFGHHDRPEHSSVMFYYDPTSHYLVGRTHSSCYFMSLGDDNLQTIHTPVGLEAAEMRMITMISGIEDTLNSADMVKHGHLIDIVCRHHSLYKVGNVVAPTVFTYPMGRTTTPAPKVVPTTTPVGGSQ
ncbi:uncharacterized protein LOC110463970 [Mizuhopecten yessoensis]|uniref:uncharacterized protein LOC110463970 n=1 Tax=Mizuhopecten yessoensis TaxID=6573 RepID=UPI000B45DF54|nr:uncharacterized protein LOC110463970 [Mizuhopecten yessoensis]